MMGTKKGSAPSISTYTGGGGKQNYEKTDYGTVPGDQEKGKYRKPDHDGAIVGHAQNHEHATYNRAVGGRGGRDGYQQSESQHHPGTGGPYSGASYAGGATSSSSTYRTSSSVVEVNVKLNTTSTSAHEDFYGSYQSTTVHPEGDRAAGGRSEKPGKHYQYYGNKQGPSGPVGASASGFAKNNGSGPQPGQHYTQPGRDTGAEVYDYNDHSDVGVKYSKGPQAGQSWQHDKSADDSRAYASSITSKNYTQKGAKNKPSFSAGPATGYNSSTATTTTAGGKERLKGSQGIRGNRSTDVPPGSRPYGYETSTAHHDTNRSNNYAAYAPDIDESPDASKYQSSNAYYGKGVHSASGPAGELQGGSSAPGVVQMQHQVTASGADAGWHSHVNERTNSSSSTSPADDRISRAYNNKDLSSWNAIEQDPYWRSPGRQVSSAVSSTSKNSSTALNNNIGLSSASAHRDQDQNNHMHSGASAYHNYKASSTEHAGGQLQHLGAAVLARHQVQGAQHNNAVAFKDRSVNKGSSKYSTDGAARTSTAYASTSSQRQTPGHYVEKVGASSSGKNKSETGHFYLGGGDAGPFVDYSDNRARGPQTVLTGGAERKGNYADAQEAASFSAHAGYFWDTTSQRNNVHDNDGHPEDQAHPHPGAGGGKQRPSSKSKSFSSSNKQQLQRPDAAPANFGTMTSAAAAARSEGIHGEQQELRWKWNGNEAYDHTPHRTPSEVGWQELESASGTSTKKGNAIFTFKGGAKSTIHQSRGTERQDNKMNGSTSTRKDGNSATSQKGGKKMKQQSSRNASAATSDDDGALRSSRGMFGIVAAQKEHDSRVVVQETNASGPASANVTLQQGEDASAALKSSTKGDNPVSSRPSAKEGDGGVEKVRLSSTGKPIHVPLWQRNSAEITTTITTENVREVHAFARGRPPIADAAAGSSGAAQKQGVGVAPTGGPTLGAKKGGKKTSEQAGRGAASSATRRSVEEQVFLHTRTRTGSGRVTPAGAATQESDEDAYNKLYGSASAAGSNGPPAREDNKLDSAFQPHGDAWRRTTIGATTGSSSSSSSFSYRGGGSRKEGRVQTFTAGGLRQHSHKSTASGGSGRGTSAAKGAAELPVQPLYNTTEMEIVAGNVADPTRSSWGLFPTTGMQLSGAASTSAGVETASSLLQNSLYDFQQSSASRSTSEKQYNHLPVPYTAAHPYLAQQHMPGASEAQLDQWTASADSAAALPLDPAWGSASDLRPMAPPVVEHSSSRSNTATSKQSTASATLFPTAVGGTDTSALLVGHLPQQSLGLHVGQMEPPTAPAVLASAVAKKPEEVVHQQENKMPTTVSPPAQSQSKSSSPVKGAAQSQRKQADPAGEGQKQDSGTSAAVATALPIKSLEEMQRERYPFVQAFRGGPLVAPRPNVANSLVDSAYPPNIQRIYRDESSFGDRSSAVGEQANTSTMTLQPPASTLSAAKDVVAPDGATTHLSSSATLVPGDEPSMLKRSEDINTASRTSNSKTLKINLEIAGEEQLLRRDPQEGGLSIISPSSAPTPTGVPKSTSSIPHGRVEHGNATPMHPQGSDLFQDGRDRSVSAPLPLLLHNDRRFSDEADRSLLSGGGDLQIEEVHHDHFDDEDNALLGSAASFHSLSGTLDGLRPGEVASEKENVDNPNEDPDSFHDACSDVDSADLGLQSPSHENKSPASSPGRQADSCEEPGGSEVNLRGHEKKRRAESDTSTKMVNKGTENKSCEHDDGSGTTKNQNHGMLSVSKTSSTSHHLPEASAPEVQALIQNVVASNPVVDGDGGPLLSSATTSTISTQNNYLNEGPRKTGNIIGPSTAKTRTGTASSKVRTAARNRIDYAARGFVYSRDGLLSFRDVLLSQNRLRLSQRERDNMWFTLHQQILNRDYLARPHGIYAKKSTVWPSRGGVYHPNGFVGPGGGATGSGGASGSAAADTSHKNNRMGDLNAPASGRGSFPEMTSYTLQAEKGVRSGLIRADGTSTSSGADHLLAHPINRPSSSMVSSLAVLGTEPIDSIQRQVTAVLNKLAPERFKKLCETMAALPIRSAADLDTVAREVFDKAVSQPTYCEMYSDMCMVLRTRYPEFPQDTAGTSTGGGANSPVAGRGGSVVSTPASTAMGTVVSGPSSSFGGASGGAGSSTFTFTRALLNRAQQEFHTAFQEQQQKAALVASSSSISIASRTSSRGDNASSTTELQSAAATMGGAGAHLQLPDSSQQQRVFTVQQGGPPAAGAPASGSTTTTRTSILHGMSGLTSSKSDDQKKKERLLGNMKFIGQLFLRKLLSQRIVRSVVSELIYPVRGDPGELSIECVCMLLKNVGKTLEASSSGKEYLSTFMARLRELLRKQHSKRIKFAIQDVLDLADNKWLERIVSLGKGGAAGVKTKVALEQDAQREQKLLQSGVQNPYAQIVAAGGRPDYFPENFSLIGSKDPEETSYHLEEAKKILAYYCEDRNLEDAVGAWRSCMEDTTSNEEQGLPLQYLLETGFSDFRKSESVACLLVGLLSPPSPCVEIRQLCRCLEPFVANLEDFLLDYPKADKFYHLLISSLLCDRKTVRLFTSDILRGFDFPETPGTPLNGRANGQTGTAVGLVEAPPGVSVAVRTGADNKTAVETSEPSPNCAEQQTLNPVQLGEAATASGTNASTLAGTLSEAGKQDSTTSLPSAADNRPLEGSLAAAGVQLDDDGEQHDVKDQSAGSSTAHQTLHSCFYVQLWCNCLRAVQRRAGLAGLKTAIQDTNPQVAAFFFGSQIFPDYRQLHELYTRAGLFRYFDRTELFDELFQLMHANADVESSTAARTEHGDETAQLVDETDESKLSEEWISLILTRTTQEEVREDVFLARLADTAFTAFYKHRDLLQLRNKRGGSTSAGAADDGATAAAGTSIQPPGDIDFAASPFWNLQMAFLEHFFQQKKIALLLPEASSHQEEKARRCIGRILLDGLIFTCRRVPELSSTECCWLLTALLQRSATSASQSAMKGAGASPHEQFTASKNRNSSGSRVVSLTEPVLRYLRSQADADSPERLIVLHALDELLKTK
ncbi:unnamed protein product [Amoebophrya sp. A120]|nr:unnamed protein product [Amoebophrya sp. A120]|eukprot:GSA120T00017983001.1